MEKKPKVAVVTGSDSECGILEGCIKLLEEFGVEVESVTFPVLSAPDRVLEFAGSAEDSGFDVIIAAAGKAVHLPALLASYTPLPVIGVPVKSSTIDGFDSLLSVMKMPNGIPVATVAIDGGVNAALLSVQILSIGYKPLRVKMKDYKRKLAEMVEEKNKNLKAKMAEI